MSAATVKPSAVKKNRTPVLATYCSDCRKTVKEKKVQDVVVQIDTHEKCPKCKGTNLRWDVERLED